MQQKDYAPNLNLRGTRNGEKAMKTVRITRILNAFAIEQDGVTAIEYALLGALIAVVIAASVSLVGSTLAALFNAVAAGFP